MSSSIQKVVEQFAREDGRAYYTVSQAAEKVGRSKWTLKRWSKDGLVKAPSMKVKMGQYDVPLYTDDDLDELRAFGLVMTQGRRTDLQPKEGMSAKTGGTKA